MTYFDCKKCAHYGDDFCRNCDYENLLYEEKQMISVENIKQIFDHIVNEAKKEGYLIGFPEIVDTPKGIKQDSDIPLFDYKWVDKKCGSCKDCYYGEIYYPFMGKFLKVRFSMM